MRGPIAFGTEWVEISLGWVVMKVLEGTHPSTGFMEISSNLSLVDITGSRTKGKAPS